MGVRVITLAEVIMAKSPYDLERNDVDGAIELFEAARQAGAAVVDLQALTRVLLKLQDDPTKLLARLPRLDAPVVA